MTFLLHQLQVCLVNYRIDFWISVNLRTTVDDIFLHQWHFTTQANLIQVYV